MRQGIKLGNVTFKYRGVNCGLLNVSLEIQKGDFLGIIGANGSGKSTLSLLLNGLIPNHIKGDFEGEVLIDGEPTHKHSVSHFAKKVGMVFQNPDFSLFNLTVEEEIKFGLNNFQLNDKDKRIKDVLEKVGLSGYQKRDPQSLSLGEKQKVCLACVLSMDVDYLVLDEPTAMLDYKNSLEVYEFLGQLHKEGKTVIVVEHNTDYLSKYAQKIVVLDQGMAIDFQETKKILSNQKMLNSLGIKIPGRLI